MQAAPLSKVQSGIQFTTMFTRIYICSLCPRCQLQEIPAININKIRDIEADSVPDQYISPQVTSNDVCSNRVQRES